MNKRRGSSYTPNVQMPGSTKPRPNRAIFSIVLCLLAPPLGLMFLWRVGVFRPRGRVLISALATVEMALLAVLIMPKPTVNAELPVPGTPVRVTAAPSSEVLTALSNMDEILKAQQAAQNPEATVGPSLVEQLQQEEAERDEIMNTIVYSVYSGAVYYHATTVCGNQSNRRELTVAEAMSEGLGACPNCNPPVYGFITATEAPDNTD